MEGDPKKPSSLDRMMDSLGGRPQPRPEAVSHPISSSREEIDAVTEQIKREVFGDRPEPSNANEAVEEIGHLNNQLKRLDVGLHSGQASSTRKADMIDERIEELRRKFKLRS